MLLDKPKEQVSEILFDDIIFYNKTYFEHKNVTLCTRRVCLNKLFAAIDAVNRSETDTIYIKFKVLDKDYHPTWNDKGTQKSEYYYKHRYNYIIALQEHVDRLTRPANIHIVCGCWDIPSQLNVGDLDILLSSPMIRRIYMVDYDFSIEHNKIKPFPIGIDIMSKRYIKNMLYYNVTNKRRKEHKIYCDSHLVTYVTYDNQRQQMIDIIKDSNNFYFLPKRTDLLNVFKNYSKYKFVISPQGLGLCCYRTWEALLCGAIIITKTSKIDPIYKGFPVVVVNDWSECLDSNNLDKWSDMYSELTNVHHVWPKLTYKHWLNT